MSFNLHFFLYMEHTVEGRKPLLRDGKEYTYQSEMRIGTGTTGESQHLTGVVFRLQTRVQVTNNSSTLNIEVSLFSILHI